MDTQNIIPVPEADDQEKKAKRAEKIAKAKKAAGKAASFAGAGAVGAAAAMGTSSMAKDDKAVGEAHDTVDRVVDDHQNTGHSHHTGHNNGHNGNQGNNEGTATHHEEFDPNDIRIEELDIHTGGHEDLSFIDEIDPITSINSGLNEDLAMIDIDDIAIDDPFSYIDPVMAEQDDIDFFSDLNSNDIHEDIPDVDISDDIIA